MVLRLYFDKMSQPSRALLMFLRANQAAIPFEEVPVALRKGEHMQDEYLKINPFRKVPVIDHDGFKLTESVAILRYLCRTFPVPEHWYPKDSKQMAKVDEFMSWQHTTLRTHGSMFFQAIIIRPRMTGQPVNEKIVEFHGNQLKNVLDQLENIWLKDQQYIAGKDLTIADLLAVTELEQPGMAGYNVRKGYPVVTQYMERVRQRLQPHYDDAHDVVRKVEKMFAQQSQGKL
ncbi:unnamed protein product [Orchesella dallaii]|uniref:Glutathione S-transferase theta-1 n=1 Tax=Orchesella dallaii TaxID=48710 RepID=A0ABP1QJB3_9HEXA